MESVHRISVDGQKGIKIKTMTRNIAGVCVCSIAPKRVQLTSRRPIDLFSLYVLVSQYRSCDNTLENSPFKFHVIHVQISMHKLWKDKGSYSPGTSIRKTKYTSERGLFQRFQTFWCMWEYKTHQIGWLDAYWSMRFRWQRKRIFLHKSGQGLRISVSIPLL